MAELSRCIRVRRPLINPGTRDVTQGKEPVGIITSMDVSKVVAERG
jgi:hypothetical protein